AAWKVSRRSAGREQELLVAVLLAAVVGRATVAEVERDDALAEHELGARLLRVLPDRLFFCTRPEALRERRALLGRGRLGSDQHDPAVCVMLPDALGGCISCHAAADD